MGQSLESNKFSGNFNSIPQKKQKQLNLDLETPNFDLNRDFKDINNSVDKNTSLGTEAKKSAQVGQQSEEREANKNTGLSRQLELDMAPAQQVIEKPRTTSLDKINSNPDQKNYEKEYPEARKKIAESRGANDLCNLSQLRSQQQSNGPVINSQGLALSQIEHIRYFDSLNADKEIGTESRDQEGSSSKKLHPTWTSNDYKYSTIEEFNPEDKLKSQLEKINFDDLNTVMQLSDSELVENTIFKQPNSHPSSSLQKIVAQSKINHFDNSGTKRKAENALSQSKSKSTKKKQSADPS